MTKLVGALLLASLVSGCTLHVCDCPYFPSNVTPTTTTTTTTLWNWENSIPKRP